MTAIENFNWMGKVLQYQMEGEAPPEYAQVSHELDFYVARVDRDPYHVLPHLPELSKNNGVPAGQFARAIILHHPVEFAFKSVPMFFVSLVSYYDNTQGNLTQPLAWLQILNRVLYMGNICFPFCALAWLFLLSWRRTRSQPRIQAMGAIVLLVLYG